MAMHLSSKATLSSVVAISHVWLFKLKLKLIEIKLYLVPRSWFLILFANKKNQGPLQKWLILRLGQQIYKMRMENLIMPKGKDVLINQANIGDDGRQDGEKAAREKSSNHV